MRRRLWQVELRSQGQCDGLDRLYGFPLHGGSWVLWTGCLGRPDSRASKEPPLPHLFNTLWGIPRQPRWVMLLHAPPQADIF